MGQYLATDPKSKAHYQLDTACSVGNVDEVKSILQEYPEFLNTYLPKSHFTPLYVVTEKNQPEVLAHLLTLSDLEINHTEENWTPLHIAAADHRTEIVRLLLTHPFIDPNIQSDESGDTPLHVASFFGLREIVQMLLQCPTINPNLRNHDGRTAEDVCCEFLPEEEQTEKPIIRKLIQGHHLRVF